MQSLVYMYIKVYRGYLPIMLYELYLRRQRPSHYFSIRLNFDFVRGKKSKVVIIPKYYSISQFYKKTSAGLYKWLV